MNIALIGYGRMGKEIEKIALSRKHNIPLIIDIGNQNDLTVENLKKVDVAIEFTIPSSAVINFTKCFEAGIPVVSGTTGWLETYQEVERACKKLDGGLFYASNFSIGVNIFFEINRKLAEIMNHYPDYDPTMEETHHVYKLDAPSGTAITLAEDIIKNIERKKIWSLDKGKKQDELVVKAIRQGNVSGTHTITYESAVDSIQISHVAKNRQGFALGAVLAAEFMLGKRGIFGMKDLLKL